MPAAWQTVLYAAGMLPVAIAVPLWLAIALWKRNDRAASVYRSLLFVPAVLAPVATAICWQFALNPLQGIAHELLSAAGLPTPNLLGDPRTALWVIDVITAGKAAGLNVMLFGAALAAVDPRTVEAARLDGASEGRITRGIVIPQLRLDGANSWQALWHVVLPLLRPALTAVGVLVFVNTWNEYLWPLIATPGGSPGTIQTGLALFLNAEGANPGPLLAAATLSSLPVLVGYLLTARRVSHAFLHSGIG